MQKSSPTTAFSQNSMIEEPWYNASKQKTTPKSKLLIQGFFSYCRIYIRYHGCAQHCKCKNNSIAIARNKKLNFRYGSIVLLLTAIINGLQWNNYMKKQLQQYHHCRLMSTNNKKTYHKQCSKFLTAKMPWNETESWEWKKIGGSMGKLHTSYSIKASFPSWPCQFYHPSSATIAPL